MSNIPDNVNTFLTLDTSGKKLDYSDSKINTMFAGKKHLDSIVSEVYHELFNIYGPIPWKVKEYIEDSINTCSRNKIWDKNISLNLIYSRDSFVLKYIDGTNYFKNKENNDKYLLKDVNKEYKNLFRKSDIISIDNSIGAIYFGIKTNNPIFKYKHKPGDRKY